MRTVINILVRPHLFYATWDKKAAQKELHKNVAGSIKSDCYEDIKFVQVAFKKWYQDTQSLKTQK